MRSATKSSRITTTSCRTTGTRKEWEDHGAMTIQTIFKPRTTGVTTKKDRNGWMADGRTVDFRPGVRINSPDFSDLPKTISPHGGIVEMPRNLCSRHAKGLAKGHVRATVVRSRYCLEAGAAGR